MKKVHFIAIGGSAMHNLAIALHRKGYLVTGSDDEIFEPSKGRLQKLGLLPDTEGWNPDKVTNQLDAVILGMHAREDNPEIAKAKELGIKIYSYPEYIFEQTKNKKRVVIGGSHGKTTITSMILHVLQKVNINTDYMVGAQLEGFDCMVKLTEQAEVAVIEGDEYLSSPIDRRPKFHLYNPHVAVLTGIAWDHINVFPTFENYISQFDIFIDKIEEGGSLIYFQGDENLNNLANKRNDISYVPYNSPSYKVDNGVSIINFEGVDYPMQVFGSHNMQNMLAAQQVCENLGVKGSEFFQAIQDFKGASKRLELITENSDSVFYKDFAHSPSKLKATTQALKQQYPERKLVACMELHTFSSLNKKFLPLYQGAMETADEAVVYFNPQVIAHKKLEPITVEEVKQAFGGNNLTVLTNSADVKNYLNAQKWTNTNLLMMTSGNFDGIDFIQLGDELFEHNRVEEN